MSKLAHPEAERAVLAAAMLTAGELFATGQLADLAPADFSEDRHRRIFEAMALLAGDDEPIDLRTVQAALERRGELGDVGGLAYLSGLDLDLPDLGRVDSYIRIVREAAIRRRLTDALRRGAQRLQEGEAPFGEVVSEANAALRQADERVAGDALVPLGDCFDRILRAMREPVPSGLVGITTGYRELDRMTLGWQAGQLIVVGARPSKGKTALACCMARAAVEVAAPPVYFSLEMGSDDLAERIACAETGLPYNAVRSGHLSSGRKAMLERELVKLSGLPLFLNDSPYLTPTRLGALLRRAKRQHGSRIAFVDYLGLMASDEPAENDNLRLTAISRALKVLAKELELPIVALHQLNRAPEKRTDQRPQLSDLRGSGSLEQDADVVVLIHRDEDPGKNEATLIVAKQRNGMTGDVRVTARLEALRFDDPTEPSPAQVGMPF